MACGGLDRDGGWGLEGGGPARERVKEGQDYTAGKNDVILLLPGLLVVVYGSMILREAQKGSNYVTTTGIQGGLCTKMTQFDDRR